MHPQKLIKICALVALLLALTNLISCLPSGLISVLTPTPMPSATPFPTQIPIPSPSLPSPTPSYTPTPYPVARPGSPLPAGRTPITLDNVKHLVHVARWGEGVATTLACSPAEPLIALGTTVGVILYEPTNVSQVASFSDAWVTSLAFSPDGSLLAMGLMNGQIQLWDIREKKELRTIKVTTDHQIKGVAFSPDGRLLASSWAGVLQVWDVATGQERQLMRYHETLMTVRFLPPGEIVVAGTFDGGLVAWRVEDGSLLLDVSQGPPPVASMAVSPDGSFIVINSSDKVRIVRGSDFSPVTEYNAGKTVIHVALDPNGKFIAASMGSVLKIWEVGKTSGEVANTIFHGTIGDPCFAHNGEYIALGLSTGEVVVMNVGQWDWRSAQGPVGPISVLTFSPNGRLLGIGTMAGSAQLWSVDTGLPLRLPRKHEGGAIWDVAFSADGERFLTASEKPLIQAWSTQTGEPLDSFDYKGKTLYSIAASPDGRYLALAYSLEDIEVLDAKNWRRTVYNYRHQIHPLTVAFNPAEPYMMASGGYEGTVWLADVERRQNVRSFQHHTSVYRVAFSPDGNMLATGLGDGSVYLWRVGDEKPMIAFIAHTYTVTGLAFGPDGRFLATASPGEQVIRFWNVSSPPMGLSSLQPVAQIRIRPIHTLEHSSPVYDLAFSPDGTLLAAGLEDGTVWLWAIP